MKKLLVLVTLFITQACLEEIGFENDSFEDALVVNATITNEEKHQVIVLSRTYRFEEDGPVPERNATVRVLSETVEYIFDETEDGKYVSRIPFSAEPHVDYKLSIVTGNGLKYASNNTRLTSISQIDSVTLTRESNDDGINGMSIYVDSFDPTNSSKYYRYEYEETYKIVAPSWVSVDAVPDEPFPFCTIKLVPKSQEEQTCYNTVPSLNINLTNTVDFTEDRVSKHLVRFIASDNYILSHRYSILIRQYIQSREAYTYFETLRNASGIGSVFSQNQPGFFSGNVFSEDDPLEKVIGFFDVSSVSSERIFFDYDDFYPGEPLPPYIENCEFMAPEQFSFNGNGCGLLIGGLINDTHMYFAPNEGQLPDGPYLVVFRACGDCTVLGSNVVPDFWEE